MEELDYELTIKELVNNDVWAVERTEAIAAIILRDNFFAQDGGGELYFYKGGIYRAGAEKAIGLSVIQILQEASKVNTKAAWTSKKGKEVYLYIKHQAPRLLEKPDLYRINVLNGIYDVRESKLLPHDPEYRTITQLAVTYDPLAKCPAWDKFIHEVFPDDEPELSKPLGYEIAAWLMCPIVEDQKAVVFLGEGANGKSIYLEGLTRFLGKQNTCNVSLQKLSERFTSTLLIGKLANISPDLSSDKIPSTGEFKALTGGDSIAAEYKNGGQFHFVPFARCVFGCNSFPSSPDISHGFYRRFNIIHFDHKFQEDANMRRTILEAITSEQELSGLFNKALEYLPRVIVNGITRTRAMQEAVIQHQRDNDPMFEWLGENTVDEGFCVKEELFKAYKASGNRGKAASSQISFGKLLKKHRPNIEAFQKRFEGGEIAWCYRGIRLLNELEKVMAADLDTTAYAPEVDEDLLDVSDGIELVEADVEVPESFEMEGETIEL